MNPELSGVTLGWRLTHTAQDELFAAIEGTAFHTRVILERMEEHGVPVRRIINGGGIPRIIMAGSSHGSTTAAQFANITRGPGGDVLRAAHQWQTWQALPSATPANRYFGFSHVLDGGWTGHHYDRSWEILGLHRFGPIVNVDRAAPPYGGTRRLITDADVKNDAGRASSFVVPGGAALKDASGKFVHEDVWRYLFTHPGGTGRPAGAQ